jgi:hypothetical protein
MSGTASGTRALSRCTVTIDSGMTVNVAIGPDGRGPAEFFARRQQQYEAYIDRFIPQIEAIFDELERDGRKFATPDDPGFGKKKQLARAGLIERVTLELVATPPLGKRELDELARRVGKVLGIKHLR